MGNLLETILGSGVKGISEGISSILDKFITTDKERLQAQKEITSILAEHSKTLVESAKDVVITEMQGNWMQKSWRPILMLAFGFIIIYEYFISSIFNLPKSNLPHEFWMLLEIGMGGYVIGRTAEKVTDSITAKRE